MSNLFFSSPSKPKLNFVQVKSIISDFESEKTYETLISLSSSPSISSDLLLPLIQNGLSSKSSQVIRLSYICLTSIDLSSSDLSLLLCNTLLKNLTHPNEFVVYYTLNFIPKMADSEIVEQLIPSIISCLGSDFDFVRRSACFCLNQLSLNSSINFPNNLEQKVATSLKSEKNSVVFHDLMVILNRVNSELLKKVVEFFGIKKVETLSLSKSEILLNFSISLGLKEVYQKIASNIFNTDKYSQKDLIQLLKISEIIFEGFDKDFSLKLFGKEVSVSELPSKIFSFTAFKYFEGKETNKTDDSEFISFSKKFLRKIPSFLFKNIGLVLFFLKEEIMNNFSENNLKDNLELLLLEMNERTAEDIVDFFLDLYSEKNSAYIEIFEIFFRKIHSKFPKEKEIDFLKKIEFFLFKEKVSPEIIKKTISLCSDFKNSEFLKGLFEKLINERKYDLVSFFGKEKIFTLLSESDIELVKVVESIPEDKIKESEVVIEVIVRILKGRKNPEITAELIKVLLGLKKGNKSSYVYFLLGKDEIENSSLSSIKTLKLLSRKTEENKIEKGRLLSGNSDPIYTELEIQKERDNYLLQFHLVNKSEIDFTDCCIELNSKNIHLFESKKFNLKNGQAFDISYSFFPVKKDEDILIQPNFVGMSSNKERISYSLESVFLSGDKENLKGEGNFNKDNFFAEFERCEFEEKIEFSVGKNKSGEVEKEIFGEGIEFSAVNDTSSFCWGVTGDKNVLLEVEKNLVGSFVIYKVLGKGSALWCLDEFKEGIKNKIITNK